MPASSASFAPMLCAHDETAARILAQPGWLYEVKLDGVRIVADKRGDRVSLAYRKARDATASYPEIAEAVRALGEERVVLDGEIVAFDTHGRPDFLLLSQRIQARPRDARRAAQAVRAVYVVFDVLAIGERDVRALPIEERKAILARVVRDDDPSALVRPSPTFASGEDLFRACKEQRLEGVVAKRIGSPYRSGERTPDWVKVKHDRDADLVVVGWTEGEGRRSRLGSLDVASYEADGRLVVRGAVGSGLDEATIDLLLDRMRDLEVARAVAEGRYAARPARRHHVRPEIVVSVRYMQFTSDGMLRHSVFRGIRADVRPEGCTVSPSSEPARVHLSGARADKHAWCKYYERAAAAMLPWLARRVCLFAGADGRPLWPLPKRTPSWVKTTLVRAGAREVRGVIVDDVDVLRFAVEAVCPTVLAQPFREGTAGQDFVALRARDASAARAVRKIVEEIGLEAFAKASGRGDGAIDVVVPIAPAPPDAARALAAIVARLAGADVQIVDAVAAPWSIVVSAADAEGGTGRRPDASDSAHAAHASPRVAAPLAWDELDRAATAATLRVLDDVHPAPSAFANAEPRDLAAAVARLERLVASLAAADSAR